MDETSTNLWEAKYKMWQPNNSILPMVYTLPKKRCSNVTITGMISNMKNKIYFKISDKKKYFECNGFFQIFKSRNKFKR